MAKVPPVSQAFTVATLVLSLALLVLVVLSMSGVVSLCGNKRTRRAAPRAHHAGAACGNQAMLAAASVPAAVPASVAAAPAQDQPAPPAGGAPAVVLLDMEAPQAVEAVRAASRDKVLYVLGQMSCPACQACKKYLAQHGHGDVSVFVDLASHGGMLKDGSLPRGVAQSLGRGVPCLVAYSHRAGAVLKKQEGFSPKAVEEMVGMVKGA
jgi:hypothetical protein